MNISDDEVGEVEWFEYLGSVLQKNGGFRELMKYRIKRGWIK